MANVEPIRCALSSFQEVLSLLIDFVCREDALMTPDHPRCVHGVAYQVTAQQVDQMFQSEGDGRIGGYRLVNVKLRTYDGEELEAVTLHISHWMAPSRRCYAPSKRYRDIIVTGCEKEGINADYTAWIAKKAYVDLEVFKKEHPGWFKFAMFYNLMLTPFRKLVWMPSLLYLPYTPYTTRTMRRVIFFPLDLFFLVGTRTAQRISDVFVLLFAPKELKELFCSTHLSKM